MKININDVRNYNQDDVDNMVNFGDSSCMWLQDLMTLNDFFKGKSFKLANTIGELHLTYFNIIISNPNGEGIIKPLKNYINQLIDCYNYLQDGDEQKALSVMGVYK